MTRRFIAAVIGLAGAVAVTAPPPAMAQVGAGNNPGTTIGLQSIVGGALVRVPFSFVAGSRLMPPGRYRITAQTVDWSVLRVARVGGRHETASVNTKDIPLSAPAIQGQTAKVDFSRRDGYYFLDRLAVPGENVRQVTLTDGQVRKVIEHLDGNAQAGPGR